MELICFYSNVKGYGLFVSILMSKGHLCLIAHWVSASVMLRKHVSLLDLQTFLPDVYNMCQAYSLPLDASF